MAVEGGGDGAVEDEVGGAGDRALLRQRRNTCRDLDLVPVDLGADCGPNAGADRVLGPHAEERVADRLSEASVQGVDWKGSARIGSRVRDCIGRDCDVGVLLQGAGRVHMPDRDVVLHARGRA